MNAQQNVPLVRIPNEYWDSLPRKVSGFIEYWLIGYIERMSAGIGLSETEALSLPDFAKDWLIGYIERMSAGIGLAETEALSLSVLATAINHAVEHGLISRRPAKQNGFHYRCRVENWGNNSGGPETSLGAQA